MLSLPNLSRFLQLVVLSELLSARRFEFWGGLVMANPAGSAAILRVNSVRPVELSTKAFANTI
jgi:hypothetical protein